MANKVAAIELLRRSGHRLTPQRLLVITVLGNQEGHATVEEIAQGVRAVYPNVDITTIYRTLQLLKQLRLVTELDLGGASRYELHDGGAHHHLVCRSCGGSEDLRPGYLEMFGTGLRRDYGFELDLEHLKIVGLCARCAAVAQPGDGAPLQRHLPMSTQVKRTTSP